MKFGTWIALKRFTQEEAAALIGCDRAQVSRWAAGRAKPDSDQMAAIYRATEGSVTANDFHDQQPIPKLPKWAKGAASV